MRQLVDIETIVDPPVAGDAIPQVLRKFLDRVAGHDRNSCISRCKERGEEPVGRLQRIRSNEHHIGHKPDRTRTSGRVEVVSRVKQAP